MGELNKHSCLLVPRHHGSLQRRIFNMRDAAERTAGERKRSVKDIRHFTSEQTACHTRPT